MNQNVRRRYWVEVAIAGLSATLAIVTAVWKDWIELVFGMDPDRGSGELKWLVIAALAAVAVALALAARYETKRVRAAGV